MKVCIGGTFNMLHNGHRALIDTAISLAGDDGYLFIGIAVGDLIKQKSDVKSYSFRAQQLISYLSEKDVVPMVVIEPISQKYGPTLNRDFDGIVVSQETAPVAQEINEQRIHKGRSPMEIVIIPFVRDDRGGIISSSRIQAGEITPHGKVLSQE